MELEIWKDIPDYEGMYQASSLGRFKSLKNKKEVILKDRINRDGYNTVALFKDGKQKSKSAQQLMAITFLNHKQVGRETVVNHKDFNRLNNELINLEIITFRENTNKKHIHSSSKYVGVGWDKSRNKWTSKITIKGITKNLGRFDCEQKASEAYQTELIKLKK